MLIRSLILALLIAFGLAGCASAPSMIEPENLYPKILTHCADEPKVPARPGIGQPRTDRAKAAYLKELHGAYADCHDTVDGWADRRAKYVKQYEQQHYGYFERVWRAVSGASAQD